MSKDRISASVDPEVASYLNQESVNASGTINRLVKQQMEAGTTQEELIRLRLEQVRDEKETLQNRLEKKEQTESELEQRLEKVQEANEIAEQITVADAAEQLKPKDWLNSLPKEEQIPPADSEEIQHYARQCDMDAKEFRSRVVNYLLDTEGDG